MAIGKKAMFFTLISIVLVIAIIAFFMPNYETYSQMSQVPALKTRFTRANTFATSVYGDMGERMLTYSSANAIRSMDAYVNWSRQPLSDIQKNFTSVLLNGTLGNGNLKTIGINFMNNNTINESLTRIVQMADKELGIKANITPSDVVIYQDYTTGYDQFGVQMNLTLQMDSGIATWNYTGRIAIILPVDNFDDPYYLMNNQSKIRINYTNATNWTVLLVKWQINGSRYVYEKDAPSFLMRFQNNTGNSTCCGIESLINPNKLKINTNVPRSYVDYCFYSDTLRESCGYSGGHHEYTLHNFTGISSTDPMVPYYSFKLEPYHISKYNLTDDINT